MKKIVVELGIEGQQEIKSVELENGHFGDFLAAVHEHAKLDGAFVFERNGDEPIREGIETKKAVSLIVHRCKRVAVHIRYEHLTKTKEFSPAATVFRVLQWATGVEAFKLDDTARAKANLMLPDGTEPLQRDAVIGQYVLHPNCEVTFDLTLKDFTNG